MKKFTIYDESTAAPASDSTRTDFDFKPRGVLISPYWDERLVWLLIVLAFFSLAYAVYYFNAEMGAAWFDQHSQLRSF